MPSARRVSGLTDIRLCLVVYYALSAAILLVAAYVASIVLLGDPDALGYPTPIRYTVGNYILLTATAIIVPMLIYRLGQALAVFGPVYYRPIDQDLVVVGTRFGLWRGRGVLVSRGVDLRISVKADPGFVVIGSQPLSYRWRISSDGDSRSFTVPIAFSGATQEHINRQLFEDHAPA